jgi:PAS domain-containing protein
MRAVPSLAISCGVVVRNSVPSASAFRNARGAGHPACGAKRSPSLPELASRSMRGSNKGETFRCRTARSTRSGEIAQLHKLLSRDAIGAREDLTPNLRRFVHSLRSPAFVLDGRWDFILRNAEARALFGGSDDLEERGNLLVEVFHKPECAALFTDYARVAEHVVAMFRLDYASHIDDARTQELVEELRATSSAFEAAWQQHGVREYPEGIREIVHPIAGTLLLAPALYGVTESPGLKIMVFTATDASTEARVASLTETSALQRRARPPQNVDASAIEARRHFTVLDGPVR